MTSKFYKTTLLIAAVFFTITFLNISCKKIALAAITRSQIEGLFEDNVLNKNFIVSLATDNGTDLTSQYTGYNFILTKTNSYYEGPMTGTKNGVTYSGTWKSNDDYSKLDINITSPAPPAEFGFINQSWKFTKKGFPTLELAPWSNEPKVLHMKRL